MSPDSVAFREATREDVSRIVEMLADDGLGVTREQFEIPLPQGYVDAFEAIQADPNQELIVAEMDRRIVGTLQISFLPYLTYRGGWRAQIEAVRIDSHMRGAGLGTEMIEWCLRRAAERGCHMVQLTSDKQRPEAIRFYLDRGFQLTHAGLKLHLPRKEG